MDEGRIVHCEQPAGKNHCAWNDNGYCHYDDEREIRKRKQLARSNMISSFIGVCNQTIAKKD